MSAIEIYALVDPRDNLVKYVGKAVNSADRFKGHLRDARRRKTPVYLWIRELAAIEMVPGVIVLEVCEAHRWQDAERSWITKYREMGQLMNLAPGGNEPFCPPEVRVESGRTLARRRDPRLWKLKLCLGQAKKRGWIKPETVQRLARIGVN